MAEGVLFDVANGIIEKVGILETGLLWSLKEEIEKLGDIVSTISVVLLDAEEQQQHSNQVKFWLDRLKDAIDEADNLLDDMSTETLKREVMTRNKKAKEVRIFFSKYNQLVYGLKMGHKVKRIRERLDAIKNDRQFHLDERPIETQVGNYRVRETHSFVRSEEVIGRDKDKEEIIRILLDTNVEESVLILPIVGLGGLGKTTLAQFVFNDQKIQNCFEQKLWVCVSDDFEVKIIVKKILECAKNNKLEGLELNTLINELNKEIDGKRYLLVLDDVWNEDPHKWLELKNLLMVGARGSRILVTTRSNIVAETTQTVQPYMLKGLDDEKSWSLFKQFASVEGQDLENSYKRAIGKEILESCEGVPLAIRTIGSLLHFKKTEKEWLSFKDNELSKVLQEENNILPTLKLSYDHLPSYLKQCFAYCCLFPKDYKIHKPTLIQMWMAQGFIRSLNQNQCLEDVGHEYFMDLLWRSFFQEVEKDKFGNILYFKIPNLMHDLAKSIAGSKYVTFYSKEESIYEKTLHVSFGGLLASQIPDSLLKARRIRTFMLQGQLEIMDKSIYSAIIKSFKFIYLLDLHNIGIQTVPTYISNLKHLRYLDLSYNSCIEMLPNSITKLQNLQTLRLSGCSKLKELPKDIKNLVNLKYLEIDKCEDLTHIPRGLGQLTNLRTLSKFVSSSVSRHNGGLQELHGLDGLRGTLEIWGLIHEDAELECKAANLKGKKHLQGLGLKWLDVYKQDVVYDERSLEALQPHPNLQQLCITLYMGVRFPSWLLSLKNLVEFSLFNCNRCPHLPPLDQLQSLKSLFLSGLDSLEYVSQRKEFSNSSFFPCLEELTLSDCPNLKGWWQQLIGDSIEESSTIDNNLQPSFPRLSKVCIWGCPKLTSVPLFPLDQIPSLKVLELGSLLALEYISNNREFSNSSFFPSLEELKLKYCPNLKGWWQRQRESMDEVNEGDDKNVGITTATMSMAEYHLMPSFPQLSKLCIWGCPKLVSMPLFPFVEKLELYYCSFQPLEQTTRIATTAMASTSSLSTCATSFAPLSKLLSMEIGRMEEPLLEASVHNLISLDHLWIYECRGPLLQGIQHLTALKQLDICSSEVFESSNDGNGIEWQGLRSLSSLWLFQLLRLESLPVGIQHVTSLRILTIDYCPCLMALPEWISNLTSLEILEILQCPKLRSLPMGISHLKFLHTLSIRYCPILLQRCKKTGNDWPKIAHIPNLYLEEGISDGEPNEQQKKLDLLRIRA